MVNPLQLRWERLFRAAHPGYPMHLPMKCNITPNSTNGLEKCIVWWIRSHGWQAERVKVMGRPIDNRKTVTDVVGIQRTIGSVQYIKSTGQKGSADISATIPLKVSNGYGVKCAIEVKWGKDRIRPDQLEYKRQIEAAGGVYIIVKTWDDFLAWFNYIADFTRARDTWPGKGKQEQAELPLTGDVDLSEFDV